MALTMIRAVGVPSGNDHPLATNTESKNNNLQESEKSIPGRPQGPTPDSPVPTELLKAGNLEIDQESVPDHGSRQAVIPDQDGPPPKIVISDNGTEPPEAVTDSNDAADIVNENEWMRYPVPPALDSTLGGLPETVLEIVRIAAEMVSAQVAEAETHRQQEEARQQAMDEEAKAEAEAREGRKSEKEKGKGKEIDYFPIIIPDPEKEKALHDEEWIRRRQAAWQQEEGLDTRRSKRGTRTKGQRQNHQKYSVSKIFGRLGVGDKGESSTAGSARNTHRTSGGVEEIATSALESRDAILRQLGVIVPKTTGQKSGESLKIAPANPLFDEHFSGIDPRLKPLRAAAALLQRNNECPDRRLSTIGSVRRRVKSTADKAVNESVSDSPLSGGEAESSKDNGGNPTSRSSDGRAGSESDGDSTEHEECISCFDEFLPDTMVKAPCHSYCRDCFTRLVANALQNEQQWPPKCCLNEIPFATIYACIETDLRNTFQSRAREWSTPIGERIYCHEPECSIWLSADQVSAGRRIATCPRNHTTCTICRGAAHEGSDCPEDRDLGRTNELAEAEGWKRCARCSALVEHGEACQHMTCRCGYEFCYVCTRVWRTCGCTMEQLADVKRQAAARRQEREEQEARDEAELQEALRDIESLELQEALEAIERSLERERRETLRRRWEISNRLEEEERRRSEVVETFFSYREALAHLHDHQREALDIDAEKVFTALEREKVAALTQLHEAHEQELTELRACGDASVEKLERELTDEFDERMAVERAAEAEYLYHLNTFWSGMKNEEAEIERAISAFRKSMGAYRGEWERWRGEEVERRKFEASENLAVRREGLDIRQGRREKEFRDREREERRRGAAGKGWLTAVVEQRDVLVRVREQQEMENALSFEAYDPVEVAIVREMRENGEEIEVLQDEDPTD